MGGAIVSVEGVTCAWVVVVEIIGRTGLLESIPFYVHTEHHAKTLEATFRNRDTVDCPDADGVIQRFAIRYIQRCRL